MTDRFVFIQKPAEVSGENEIEFLYTNTREDYRRCRTLYLNVLAPNPEFWHG